MREFSGNLVIQKNIIIIKYLLVSLQMVTRTKKIFVGGLSAPTTLEDVKSYFEQFGTVSNFLYYWLVLILILFSVLNDKVHSFTTAHNLDSLILYSKSVMKFSKKRRDYRPRNNNILCIFRCR